MALILRGTRRVSSDDPSRPPWPDCFLEDSCALDSPCARGWNDLEPCGCAPKRWNLLPQIAKSPLKRPTFVSFCDYAQLLLLRPTSSHRSPLPTTFDHILSTFWYLSSEIVLFHKNFFRFFRSGTSRVSPRQLVLPVLPTYYI